MDKALDKFLDEETKKKLKRFQKKIKPYIPIVARVLLVLTFFEDAFRVMYDTRAQINFLKYEYNFPGFVAGFLIITSTMISVIGSILVVLRKREAFGAYLLVGFLLYQQAMYGKHSPLTSGNIGFLFRNLCLAGSFLLLIVQSRMKEGHSAIPGIPDAGDKNDILNYLQVFGRCLLALLALELVSSLGPIGVIITMPVIGAVLVGYKTQIAGILLMIIYLIHNCINSPFWATTNDFQKDVRRFEFMQTLSIMGGLVLLIADGPGSLSVDETLNRRKNF